MATVITSIGLPGSGKTTFMTKVAEEHNAVYVCADDIRAEMTGDASDMSRDTAVWKLLYQRVRDAIGAGKTVVIDVTNARQVYRRQLVERCRNFGATEVIGMWMQTPLEHCLKLNAARERQVPEEEIERMHRSLLAYPPALSDGFDYLINIASPLADI